MIIQEIPRTKLPKQHHNKKTVYVNVYQNTRRDTQRHNTETLGGGWKYRLGTVSDTCHWRFKPGLEAPNIMLIPSPSYKTYSVYESIPSPTNLQQPRLQTQTLIACKTKIY